MRELLSWRNSATITAQGAKKHFHDDAHALIYSSLFRLHVFSMRLFSRNKTWAWQQQLLPGKRQMLSLSLPLTIWLFLLPIHIIVSVPLPVQNSSNCSRDTLCLIFSWELLHGHGNNVRLPFLSIVPQHHFTQPPRTHARWWSNEMRIYMFPVHQNDASPCALSNGTALSMNLCEHSCNMLNTLL